MAVGLRERGDRPGDKVLIHAENSPEMLLAWLACATLGAVAVTTNTRSVAAEIEYFVEKTCVRRRHHPDAAASTACARPAPSLKWIAVIPTQPTPLPVLTPGSIPFDALRGRRRRLARPIDRADAAVRDHVHLRHDQPAQGGGAHPRQRGVGQPHAGPATSTSAPTTAT